MPNSHLSDPLQGEILHYSPSTTSNLKHSNSYFDLQTPSGDIERFKATSAFGEGSLGVVTIFQSAKNPKKICAAKKFKKSRKKEKVENEFDSLKKIHSNFTFKLVDVSDGSQRILMPKFPGHDLLNAIIAAENDMKRYAILLAFLQEMNRIHTAPVSLIHGDIKPTNVLVDITTDPNSDSITIYFIDCGLSYPVIQKHILTYLKCSNLLYIAPERTSNTSTNAPAANPAQDIYSCAYSVLCLIIYVENFSAPPELFLWCFKALDLVATRRPCIAEVMTILNNAIANQFLSLKDIKTQFQHYISACLFISNTQLELLANYIAVTVRGNQQRNGETIHQDFKKMADKYQLQAANKAKSIQDNFNQVSHSNAANSNPELHIYVRAFINKFLSSDIALDVAVNINHLMANMLLDILMDELCRYDFSETKALLAELELDQSNSL